VILGLRIALSFVLALVQLDKAACGTANHVRLFGRFTSSSLRLERPAVFKSPRSMLEQRLSPS